MTRSAVAFLYFTAFPLKVTQEEKITKRPPRGVVWTDMVGHRALSSEAPWGAGLRLGSPTDGGRHMGNAVNVEENIV